MAPDHVPCEVSRCRRAAVWIVWKIGISPMLLCEADRRILFHASENLPLVWYTLPLQIGVN